MTTETTPPWAPSSSGSGSTPTGSPATSPTESDELVAARAELERAGAELKVAGDALIAAGGSPLDVMAVLGPILGG